MVAQLQPPSRPLPSGGATWTWSHRRSSKPRGQWVRVYHRGRHTPHGHTARTWGPVARFDPHLPDAAGARQVDPDGRSVLYVGADLATSLCEVFGERRDAPLCPNWRAAVLKPARPMVLFDLCRAGAAMAIGALPALGDGNEDRDLTQRWARAIYEDQPAYRHVTGIHYRSAYNGGISLALWDSDGRVRTRVVGARVADHPLASPELLPRVRQVCVDRLMSLELISTNDCDKCP